MSSNATGVIEILNPFGSQQIDIGERTVWFVAGLIKAVKIFWFIQHLEFFLHLGKSVNTSVSMTQDLFSSPEVVKPDCFENIAVNWCNSIQLFLWSDLCS